MLSFNHQLINAAACARRSAIRLSTEPPGSSSFISISIFTLGSSALFEVQQRYCSVPSVYSSLGKLYFSVFVFVFSLAFYILYLSPNMFCTFSFFFFLRKAVPLCIYRYLHGSTVVSIRLLRRSCCCEVLRTTPVITVLNTFHM